MADKMKQPVNSTSLPIGYDSAFLSISIVFLNIASALIRFNNENLSTFDVADFNFVFLVLSLSLVSVDMIISMRRYGKTPLVILTYVFAIPALVLSLAILLSSFLLLSTICSAIVIDDIIYMGCEKNFSFVHTSWGLDYFKMSNFPYMYLGSAVLHGMAGIFKVLVNRRNKKDAIEQNLNNNI